MKKIFTLVIALSITTFATAADRGESPLHSTRGNTIPFAPVPRGPVSGFIKKKSGPCIPSFTALSLLQTLNGITAAPDKPLLTRGGSNRSTTSIASNNSDAN